MYVFKTEYNTAKRKLKKIKRKINKILHEKFAQLFLLDNSH